MKLLTCGRNNWKKTEKMTTGVNFTNVFLRLFFVQNFGAKPNVTRKKLPKQRLYKKRTQNMLVKLTTGVNFTNILRAAFSKTIFHQKITKPNSN